MITNWSKYENFSEWEFDSPDVPGSGSYFDEETLDRLSFARKKSDCPYDINSGCRSDWYNDYVEGVPDSEHKYILNENGILIKPATGVDIGFSKATFPLIMKGLTAAGFTRLGVCFDCVHPFIHTDASTIKPSPWSWSYPIKKSADNALSVEIGWDR